MFNHCHKEQKGCSFYGLIWFNLQIRKHFQNSHGNRTMMLSVYFICQSVFLMRVSTTSHIKRIERFVFPKSINCKYLRFQVKIVKNQYQWRNMHLFHYSFKWHYLLACYISSTTRSRNSTCQQFALGNQRFPVPVRLLPMCRGELFPVISRLMSKCLWSGWKW